jgi:hypothetical protein
MGSYCSLPHAPPRTQLRDPRAAPHMLYTAISRLGYDLIGVYAVHTLLYDPKQPRRLCEFRSERGNTLDGLHLHSSYLAHADSTKDIVI